MMHRNCDVSPLLEKLREDLEQISADIEESLNSLGDQTYCLLGKFEQIRERFSLIETTAASFYLMCYLSPFTDKYLDLSVSIQHLSEKRHGALIVVQREDQLDSYIQRGTPIDAHLSSSLLESIFYPGSPLHDGAVLIQSNQIVSAANVLPLSQIAPGGRKLGTRHRAALGLTERSDALVLVVSEETGKASFAMNGRLYPVRSHQ